MDNLKISSSKFILLIKGFKNWLEVQNYSEKTARNYISSTVEFLSYLELKGIESIDKITSNNIEQFISHVKIRPNKTREGALTSNSINSIIRGVVKFLKYLSDTKNIYLSPEIASLKSDTKEKDILTKSEIEGLFNSLDNSLNPILKRDMAILAILYGAGLRKSEIQNLNLEDVSLTKRTIHVRNGKGNKERLVPVAKKFNKMLKDYITDCRDIHAGIAKKVDNAFFIDINGDRIKSDTYYDIIKRIIKNSGIESLECKVITPHTFRHSVATHLLQNGLDLESIAMFLGHSSLDSTMIYTHIVEQLKVEDGI